MTTIRLLHSISASKNWFLHQLDINTTFLHGNLDDEVYMNSPFGLHLPFKNIVCKLSKFIYNLKPANKQWNHILTTSIISLRYSQSKSYYSLLKMIIISLIAFLYMLMIYFFRLTTFQKYKISSLI